MSWNTIWELFILDEGKLQIKKYERESPGILVLSLRVNRKLDPGGGIRALLSTPSAKTYEVLEDDGTPVRFTSREWRYYWTRPTGEELVGGMGTEEIENVQEVIPREVWGWVWLLWIARIIGKWFRIHVLWWFGDFN